MKHYEQTLIDHRKNITMYRHVDYAAYYCQLSTPIKIRGETTYKTLNNLQNKLCASASKVNFYLDGGDHGYLENILNNIEHQLVLGGVSFAAPVYPPALNIGTTATPVEAVHLREYHHELNRKYKECCNVEKLLLYHVQQEFDDMYIEPFINNDTDIIST